MGTLDFKMLTILLAVTENEKWFLAVYLQQATKLSHERGYLHLGAFWPLKKWVLRIPGHGSHCGGAETSQLRDIMRQDEMNITVWQLLDAHSTTMLKNNFSLLLIIFLKICILRYAKILLKFKSWYYRGLWAWEFSW